MTPENAFEQTLRQVKVLRPPKHSLATFGSTQLRYLLLSPLPGEPDQCRIREGEVKAEKPKIVTPEYWRKRFEGFGEESQAYGEQIERSYGEAFRGLEYGFRNELRQTTLEHTSFTEMVDRTAQVIKDAPRTALLEGPDLHWPLAIMKFIVEVSLQSFPSNIRELEEHDFFHPEGRQEARNRRLIENMFKQAASDSSLVAPLGEALKKMNVFQEYEDRFFTLLRRR